MGIINSEDFIAGIKIQIWHVRWLLSEPPMPASLILWSCPPDVSTDGVFHADRGDTYGSRPIPLTFQMPSANANILHPTNAAFTNSICCAIPGLSNL